MSTSDRWAEHDAAHAAEREETRRRRVALAAAQRRLSELLEAEDARRKAEAMIQAAMNEERRRIEQAAMDRTDRIFGWFIGLCALAICVVLAAVIWNLY